MSQGPIRSPPGGLSPVHMSLGCCCAGNTPKNITDFLPLVSLEEGSSSERWAGRGRPETRAPKTRRRLGSRSFARWTAGPELTISSPFCLPTSRELGDTPGGHRVQPKQGHLEQVAHGHFQNGDSPEDSTELALKKDLRMVS